MLFKACLVMALAGPTQAFAPTIHLGTRTRVVSSASKGLSPKQLDVAKLAPIAATFAPVAAVAREGVGDPFGVDNPILWLAFIPFLLVNVAFYYWDKGQVDEGDFFAERSPPPKFKWKKYKTDAATTSKIATSPPVSRPAARSSGGPGARGGKRW